MDLPRRRHLVRSRRDHVATSLRRWPGEEMVHRRHRGVSLGVAYGIWAASGVALTAILARVIFHEPLTRTMALGILFIAVGVLTVEIGAILAN